MSEGFVQFGDSETDLNDSSYEDFLVADRQGLEHLKSKIDAVLEDGDELRFSDDRVFTDLEGIKLASRTTPQPPASGGMLEVVFSLGCVVIVGVVISIFVVGFLTCLELLQTFWD